MLLVSEKWKTTYPGAAAGILVMKNVANPARHSEFDGHKEAFQKQLRSRFAGYDRAGLKALPTIQAYNTYYKRYKKSYHVQLQLESVALKGRSIPRIAALVEAMFMAELNSLLLTAGHDLETVQQPIRLKVAEGTEFYTLLNGKEQLLKTGDMLMADAEGVISSVIYGPDRRTRITPETRQVFFGVYAVPGVANQTIQDHLEDIRDNIMIFAQEAEVDLLQVYATE
ncbi:MAG: phenylalanine--tRNA ligase beta subunit-related protein [Syntrophobacterales bacterium]|jgi:DNA/RNA-binding domain of Phe-tRNA-synthetase-like protein